MLTLSVQRWESACWRMVLQGLLSLLMVGCTTTNLIATNDVSPSARPPVTSVCGLYEAVEYWFGRLREAGLALENGDRSTAKSIVSSVTSGLEQDIASFDRNSPSDVAVSGTLGAFLVETAVREAALAAIGAAESPNEVSFASGLATTDASLNLARSELRRLQSTSGFACFPLGSASPR
jgi:hypothetical protein